MFDVNDCGKLLIESGGYRMNNKLFHITLLLSCIAIAGCASRATSIAPTAVPSANYKGLNCDETKTLLAQKMATKNALVTSQNNAATGDAVGVFFVLLPVGSIFGADKEGELAQAKGEVMALNGAVSINCKETTNADTVGNPSSTEKNKANSTNDISEKLVVLKRLYNNKTITEKEYETKRKQILDGL